MRRASIGWLGAGLAASTWIAAGALGCSSKGTVSSGGAGGEAATGSTASSGSTGSTASAGGSSTGSGTTTSSGTGGTAVVGDSVLMHHKNLNRDGVYVEPALTKAAAAGLTRDPTFNVTLPDPNDLVYAQPLFLDGGATGKDLVFVVTEANNVYALDGASGAVVWKKNVGVPVPLAKMPCGNIDPYGITGTPVIDFPSRTLFFDAMNTPDGGTTLHHQIFALSIDDGSIRTGWPVDVGAKAKSGATTFNVAPQGERGALAVLGGTLYVSYGGLYGDCGDYHGWVVAVPLADPTTVQAWATTAQAGGSWAMGGVTSDGTNLYIGTGNTMGANGVWGGGDAIIRFTPGATFPGATPEYWSPKNWVTLDNQDLDMGSAPIVFNLPGATPQQLALIFGKDGNAYLANPNNLGGVSDPLATFKAATNEIICAPALYTTSTATYVAYKGAGAKCTTGSGAVSTLKIVPGSPPTLAGSWCAPGGNSSPMVTTSDGTHDVIVWSPGSESDMLLHGYDGDTGAVVFGGGGVKIPNMRRYNTPIAAKGRIFVAADFTVVAFKP